MRYKIQDNALETPSVFRSTWKTLAYSLIWTAIFFPLFLCFYTIDDVAYELDYFTMYGFSRLGPLLLISTAFWFFLRQSAKDLNFIRFYWGSCLHAENVVKQGGYKRAIDGDEGTGKTLNNAYDTLLIGAAKDRAMRLAYYLKAPYSDELRDDVDFNVLRESFEYFERNGLNIPHVMANFEIIYKGKKNYPFSMEYLDQTKRLAEGFACGITEMGNILPNAWSKLPAGDKEDPFNRRVKNETLSLSRQFFDLTITADEQRTGEIFLGYRSLVTFNRHLVEKKKVCRPIFLEKIQNILRKKVFKTGKLLEAIKATTSDVEFRLYKHYVTQQRAFESCDVRSIDETLSREKTLFTQLRQCKKDYKKVNKRARKVSLRYRKLAVLIEDIGFYKFTYELRDPQTNALIAENMHFVIPCDIPFEFDTRGERFNYDLYSHVPE